MPSVRITYGSSEPSCYYCLGSNAQQVRVQGGSTKYVCDQCLSCSRPSSRSSSSQRSSYDEPDSRYYQGPQYDVHRSYSSRRSSYRSSGYSSPSSSHRSYYSSY